MNPRLKKIWFNIIIYENTVNTKHDPEPEETSERRNNSIPIKTWIKHLKSHLSKPHLAEKLELND